MRSCSHNSPRSGRRSVLGGLLAALVAGVVTAWLGEIAATDRPLLNAAPSRERELAVSLERLFADVAERVKRCVVSVDASPRGQRGTKPAIGSGFIIDSRGFILTNHHLVEGGAEIMVRLHDNRQLTATVVQSDPATDVALVKVEGVAELPALPMGEVDSLRVGQWVLAVGSPFGLTQTVSAGIVSALRRSDLRLLHSESFIQTDASINPGNSGGPLVNLRGEAIGINTAIFSNAHGGNQGIGFAVPIDLAGAMAQRWMDGKATNDLGVVISRVDRDMADYFGLPSPRGAFVVRTSGSEDLLAKDVVVKFNGIDVRDDHHLRLLVIEAVAGKDTLVEVYRGGKLVRVTTQIRERSWQPQHRAPSRHLGGRLLGLTVTPLTRALAAELGLAAATPGIVVMEVESGSPASLKGVQVEDVILEVNDTVVGTLEQLRTSLRRQGHVVMLRLVRDGEDIGYHFLPRQPPG